MADELIEGFDEYRVATYPDTYPDMTHKKVNVVKVSKKLTGDLEGGSFFVLGR